MAQEPNAEPEKKEMDAAQLQTFKQLKIQSGALNRLTIDLRLYMEELAKYKTQLTALRENDDEEKEDKVKSKIKSKNDQIKELEPVIQDVYQRWKNTIEKVDEMKQELKWDKVNYKLSEEDQEEFKKADKFLLATEGDEFKSIKGGK
mmetsp:Transcript_52010/g.46715  ORF Transcript_52010/g.46715 Transcript_52010/m.46715 type:complete len:147 (+) Transcript_52010:99-539(+)